MNVLFIDQFGEIGGAQRCLLDLLPAVLERGWGARAVLPGRGPFAEALETLGVPVDCTLCGPYSSGRKTLGDLTRFAADLPGLIREIRRRTESTLLYVNGPRLLPAAALAAAHRLPVLFHCHSYLFRNYAARLAGWSLKHAKATLVASCRFVAQPLLGYVSEDRRHVVYNGVPASSPAIARQPAGPRRIGVIGRIAPEKGQAEFLEAARILHAEAPDCRFVICGAPLFSDAGGYVRRLEALAEGLPVEFLGWRENTSPVLAGLDLLVAPSPRIDATPRVIIEAFAAGVPVVAFRAGGIPEVVSDEVTGFLVDPPDARALAARLQGLIRASPHRLAEVVQNARAAWQEKFSVERYRREMLDRMEEAASETAGPR